MADPDPAFKLRVVSALVLAPLALGMTILGGFAFALLMALLLVLMAAEWRVLTRARFGQPGGTLVGSIGLGLSLLALLLTALDRPLEGLALLLAGAPLAAGVAWLLGLPALWTGLGVVYLGLPLLALIWLRATAGIGLALLIWLLVVVWTTDTVAYFTGRNLGGPRLAPRISPSKTWAGLCGGVIGAALAGVAAAALAGSERLLHAGWLGALLAVVAQLGDLAESALKRRAGVKDSGRAIPGHGGLLDRVDGLLFAAPALAALGLLWGPRAWPWQ